MRLIDKFKVLLLDMNKTFMFGGDRFEIGENFHERYRSAGGNRLSSAEVSQFIRACYEGMSRDYDDPGCYDNFPTLREGFQRYANPPDFELPLLEHVFTYHELGSIPDDCAALLRRLSRTHRLAVVTNIWSPKEAWLNEFKRSGIDQAFQVSIFSSDFRSIKPSAVIFEEALRRLRIGPDDALFVGDSLRYDMEGARQAGLKTVWLTSAPIPHPSVDYVLAKLQDLERFAPDESIT